MPFQPAPGVAEGVVRFEQDKQIICNVYHAFIGTGWSEIALNDWAQDIRDFIQTTMLPVMASTVRFLDVTVTDISTENGGQVTKQPTGNSFGGTEAAALPNNVALVVKWLTQNRGRSFRGRTYHIGLVNTVVDKNTVVAGFLASLIAKYQALMDMMSDGLTREFCVLSRVADHAPRPEAICTPIVEFKIDPTVDSQRRRLPGRGN